MKITGDGLSPGSVWFNLQQITAEVFLIPQILGKIYTVTSEMSPEILLLQEDLHAD